VGGDKGGGVSNSTAENAQAGLATQLTSLLSQQQGESSQLFNLAFPGMVQSQDFYQSLASGNPDLIAKAIAPAAQQLSQQATGAKQNIMQNAPSGGEKNLALENVDVAQGSQLGALASQGYTSSFNALAELGGHGVQLGQGAAGTAISAGSAAGNQWGNIVQQNIQQKGASLGAFGALAGDVAGLGGSLFGAAGSAGSFGALFA
jgi:hypothetical protein